MKKTMFILLTTFLLVGCGNQSSGGGEVTPPKEGDYLFYNLKQGQTKDGLTGSPWLNTTEVGIPGKVEKPKLTEDFYLSSNYDFLSTAKLEPGQIGTGGTIQAINTLQDRYVALGSGTANKGSYSDAFKKAYTLYNESDNTKSIDAAKALISEIQAIGSLEQLDAFLISKKGASFASSYFDLTRTADGAYLMEEPNGLSPSILSTPFMNQEEEAMENIATKFAPVLVSFGISESNAQKMVKDALQQEAYLRQSSGESMSSEGYKVSELNSSFGSVALGTLFKSFGYQDNDIIRFTSDIFNIYSNLGRLQNTELELVKANLIFRVCLGAKTIYPIDQYVALLGEFDQQSAGYSQDMFVRERLIYSVLSLFDRTYIDNYETKERKDLIIQLMGDVKSQYKTIVGNAEWLSSSTKTKAVEKLDAIKFDACYPDHLLSLPSLSFEATVDNFYSMANSYREWSFNANQPAKTNPELWVGSVTTLNAVYYPDSNSFVMYDGLLIENSYSATDIEGMYGTVGTVIGHEISHSIDDNGSLYDKYGMREDWWTPEDRTSYLAKQKKVTDYWDKLSYKDGVKMWSSKMLGEIIADMGGVSVILDLASKKANFDYQKFFLAYSASYASVFSKEFIDQMFYLVQDSHPMNYLRVNAVVNQFDKFLEIFNVKEGDPMYTAKADRIAIW